MFVFPGKLNKLMTIAGGAYRSGDFCRAAEYYRQAAELGYAPAMRRLGRMYQNGYGVEQNYLKARKWYLAAAEQSDAAAENLLGNLYFYGYTGEEDYEQAASWYSRAAVHGSTLAQYNLGYLYENGMGVGKNDPAAFRWYKMSALGGNRYGQTGLGNMFRYGKGVTVNLQEAEKWYRLAAEQGYDRALQCLESLKKDQSGEEASAESEEHRELPELEDMIGLEGVKEEVSRMISLAKLQKLREENGMKTVPVSKHLAFIGNPGTGKTTVARILAEKYREIGILSQGQLVEVSRADLVAGYIGQTAIKTKKMISKAMGGILFIDEAYTLANGGMNDFGQEAIDTLIKEMEDHREDLIIIVAGYPDLMEDFIASNPGLKSRFSKSIYFEDYSAENLREIFRSLCREHGLYLREEAEEKAAAAIEDLSAQRGEDFANARDIRNFFEAMYSNQAVRLAAKNDLSPDDVLWIEASDIPTKNE